MIELCDSRRSISVRPRKMNASGPSAPDPSGTKREACLRPWRRRNGDVQDFHKTEAHLLHVPLSSPHEPCVDEAQEHHVVGYLHAMSQEVAEFAPRRVCDDPVNRVCPRHEVRSFVDFTFFALPIKSANECFTARARFKDSTAWPEVIHNQVGRVIGSIDPIISAFGSKRTRRPNKAMD